MMRILTPKGVLREVARVTPVCEARLNFNGAEKRFVEIIRDNKAASTGLIIYFQPDNRPDMFGACAELFIGNLKPEQVKDIQKKLLSQGYFDFSELKYQNAVAVSETVFDNGASEPYTSDYTMGAGMSIGYSTPDIFSMGISCAGWSTGWGSDDSDTEEEGTDESE